MNKIELASNKHKVRIQRSPGAETFEKLSQALENDCLQTLIGLIGQNLVPFKFLTDQTVGNGGQLAELKILPQELTLTRTEDGRGWRFAGQSMPESDFRKKEDPLSHPRIEGYISSATGEGSFAVV